MKRVVVLQSSYIPWKGYFDLVASADLFVFLDDVQFTTRDWRSRNRIKSPGGFAWLSIPTGSRRGRRICDVEVTDQRWKDDHRRLIARHYAAAPYLAQHADLLDFLYANDLTNLSEFNQRAIVHLSRRLGLQTAFLDSRALGASGTKTDRLIDMMARVKGTHYISGPAAKAYLDERAFHEAGLTLVWKDYAGYPEYPQLHGQFLHEVSVLDVFFNVGADAPRFVISGSATAPCGPSS